MELDDMAIYYELRAACLAVFERHGIPADCVKADMLLSRVQVRNAVIRREYRDAGKGECDSKRNELARRHGISEDHVHRVLYS